MLLLLLCVVVEALSCNSAFNLGLNRGFQTEVPVFPASFRLGKDRGGEGRFEDAARFLENLFLYGLLPK